MGDVECASCGALVNAGATRCPDCGDSVAGTARVAAARTSEQSPAMEHWTRRALLYECRNDPRGATTQAYHHAGYVWTFDRKLDRERCFHWRAHPNDSFKRGLPVDEQDRREILTHQMEASAAPETGWHHFRFCECRSCSPAEHESKRQRRLNLLVSLPLVCVFFLGMFLAGLPEPADLVGLVMILGSGAIFVLWERRVHGKRRSERQKRRRQRASSPAPAAAETEGRTPPPPPPGTQPSVPLAPAAAQGIRAAPPDTQLAQPSMAAADEPPAAPEPPEAPQAPSAP